MARTKAQAQKRSSVGKTVPDDGTRKKRRFKHATIAKREVKRYQATTNALVPKLAMDRLIRETVQDITPTNIRFTKNAIAALQEAAEQYVVDTMEVGDVMRQHAGRDTLMQEDLKLASIIMNTIFTSTSA